jgi:integral membrane sensor domain MASE1
MFRILFAGALAVVVGAMLDWIGVLWDVSQNAYQQIYGKPMAHPRGDTLDHLNDWLAFLPSDPATRAAIVAGAIVGLLTLTFVANLLGIFYGKNRQERQVRSAARDRTISSYHKVQ